MLIKDMPKADRPREKLEKYGPERLSNSELLAVLLGAFGAFGELTKNYGRKK